MLLGAPAYEAAALSEQRPSSVREQREPGCAELAEESLEQHARQLALSGAQVAQQAGCSDPIAT